jgi:hypothetical protein
MRLWRARRARRRGRVMPRKFEALAVYNTERHHGLVHTPGYDAQMAELQREFDEWQRETAPE